MTEGERAERDLAHGMPAGRRQQFGRLSLAALIGAYALVTGPAVVAQEIGDPPGPEGGEGGVDREPPFQFEQTFDMSSVLSNREREGDLLATFSVERDFGAWTFLGESNVIGADDPARVPGANQRLDIESLELEAQLARERSRLDLSFGDVTAQTGNELVASGLSGRGMTGTFQDHDTGLSFSVGLVSPDYLTGYADGLRSRDYDGHRGFAEIAGEHEISEDYRLRWGLQFFDGKIEDRRFGDVEDNRVTGAHIALERNDRRLRYSLAVAQSDYEARTAFGSTRQAGHAVYQDAEFVVLDGETYLSLRFEHERISPGFRAMEAAWTSDLEVFRSGIVFETEKIDATLDWTLGEDNLRGDPALLTTRSNELRGRLTYYLEPSAAVVPATLTLDAGQVRVAPRNAAAFLATTGLGRTALDKFSEHYGGIEAQWELDRARVRLGYERTIVDDRIAVRDEDFEEDLLRVGYSFDAETWGMAVDARLALASEDTRRGSFRIRDSDWEISAYYDAPRRPRFSARLSRQSRQRTPRGNLARDHDGELSLQMSLTLDPVLPQLGLPEGSSAEIFADTIRTSSATGGNRRTRQETIFGMNVAMTF